MPDDMMFSEKFSGAMGTRVAMTDLAREVYDRWLADFPPEERGEGYLKADIWYMEHWSFLLDLYIMYKTVANALHKDKQAY